MQHTLIAVFDNRADAQNAMDELLASGFSSQDVRISQADATGMTDSVSGSTVSASDTGDRDEGFGASIRHFFSDIFGTDESEHAQKYSTAVTRGHHVLTVTTESEPEVERAADVVERHGPVDIDEKHSEWAGGAAIAGQSAGLQQSAGMSQQSDDRNLYQQQSLNTAEPMGTTYQEPLSGSGSSLTGSSQGGSQQRDTSVQGSALTGSMQRDAGLQRDTETSRAIPVVEENLKIGKREVQRGGVRIYSRLVETPVNESVSLREEHVNVQRRPVDQPINPSDVDAFKEQSIEMRETAEEAVVQKSARVVEEVLVGKQTTERTEQINDTLRRTEVEVEQLDNAYRSHYNSSLASTGASYDDYEPAYRYGSEARSKYQGRDWDDVESDLRSDWDTRYGSSGGSTWEKMKSAVRHGWDKMTGDSGTSAGIGSSLRSSTDDDDDYFRNHWSSNYASTGSSYDDYAPAYRYGTEMRSNSRYANRKWDDVEPELRSDWDTRYGSSGGSTWEKMKAAVRHGWDRMTS